MDGGHIALKIYMGNELDSCKECNHTATFNEEFLMISFLHKNNLLNKRRTCQSRLPLGAASLLHFQQQLRVHRLQRHLLDCLLHRLQRHLQRHLLDRLLHRLQRHLQRHLLHRLQRHLLGQFQLQL